MTKVMQECCDAHRCDMAPQRELFDTHNLRRGFVGEAIRHAQSPQRVRGRSCKFARHHCESAPTRTISAEGSRAKLQSRTAPRRGRFDTRSLRRGFAGKVAKSHTARAIQNAQAKLKALRHTRPAQRVHPSSAHQTHPRRLRKSGCVSRAA